MGITTEEFFNQIYNVMFSPKTFFEDESLNISTRLAIFVISGTTILNKISFAIVGDTIHNPAFIFGLIGSAILAVIMWFLIALFFEYMAKIFEKGGRLSKLLYLSAFSTIPTLFFAPLNLLKQVGEIGYILAVIIEFLLYLWIICLYAFSVKSTYNITLARSFMLIILPIVSSFLAIYQIVGFCHKMWYIFSI